MVLSHWWVSTVNANSLNSIRRNHYKRKSDCVFAAKEYQLQYWLHTSGNHCKEQLTDKKGKLIGLRHQATPPCPHRLQSYMHLTENQTPPASHTWRRLFDNTTSRASTQTRCRCSDRFLPCHLKLQPSAASRTHPRCGGRSWSSDRCRAGQSLRQLRCGSWRHGLTQKLELDFEKLHCLKGAIMHLFDFNLRAYRRDSMQLVRKKSPSGLFDLQLTSLPKKICASLQH